MKEFINVFSKNTHYMKNKNDVVFTMRPLIYDSSSRVDAKTTQAMTWISFPILLSIYYVKEAFFSLAYVVEKPLQLDMTIIYKIRTNCVRVKV